MRGPSGPPTKAICLQVLTTKALATIGVIVRGILDLSRVDETTPDTVLA